MSMSEAVEHYERLLGRHYTWMLGDFAEAVSAQRELLEKLLVRNLPGGARHNPGIALDLGCGSGVQSIALAELGYNPVIGIDTSLLLLAELTERAAGLPAIMPVQADITSGLRDLVAAGSAGVVVCMGDTLPHLPTSADVRKLFEQSFDLLAPGGVLVLSFRDLTAPPEGLSRFIPVRSDDEKIMTCFLEDEGDAVRIHDLIHTRDANGAWCLGKSSYRKLKLAPAEVVGQLQEIGFTPVAAGSAPRGMVVVTATRPGRDRAGTG
ncbi:MAG: class I SAM-dependent methyltransferase [Gemmatimonadota bacterium]|jgi:SAM-dependent methyltransferase|nr:class I SAM-dependent methyltransferase [Gemmatimonadota bacterium]